MRAITSKFEINVYKENVDDPVAVIDFAKRYGCHGIVVDPSMFYEYYITKIKRGGDFDLGVMVDFPRGESIASAKITNLPQTTLEADFMDVMFRKGSDLLSYKKDLAFIKQTVQEFIGPIEIRPVLELDYDDNTIKNMSNALKEVTMPRIRTRSQAVTPNNIDHVADIKKAGEATARPLKIGGNVDINTIIETYRSMIPDHLYDVTYSQAKAIVKAMEDPKVAASIMSEIDEDTLVIEDLDKREATITEAAEIVEQRMVDILNTIEGAKSLTLKEVDGKPVIEISVAGDAPEDDTILIEYEGTDFEIKTVYKDIRVKN